MSQKSNKIFIRFKFHTRVQTSADTFDSFVIDLKLLFQECGYADLDLMARDQIVLGVSLPMIQGKQLISVGSDLILRNAVEIAQIPMARESSTVSSVNFIKTGQKKKHKKQYLCGRVQLLLLFLLYMNDLPNVVSASLISLFANDTMFSSSSDNLDSALQFLQQEVNSVS